MPRYKATDPAGDVVNCKCSREDCWTSGLLPLRDHMAALYRAILALGYEERFADYGRGDDPWPGVIYGLEMSASLEDLSADPTYVSDNEAWTMCGAAWDRDEEDRELASKYAAALITFNFAWMAYEAAVELSAGDLHAKDKTPVRGRKIFASEAAEAERVMALPVSYRVAHHYCLDIPDVSGELDANVKKYGLSAPAAAAEIVRLFRNHVLHGRDPLPAYSEEPCRRFYAMTRLLLLLMQHLVARKIIEPDQPVRLSINHDEVGTEPAGRYLKNLHYKDERWRANRPVRQCRRFP